MSETRYQRVAREQRERQEARAAKWKADSDALKRKRNTARKAQIVETYEDRLDDLGHSPDY